MKWAGWRLTRDASPNPVQDLRMSELVRACASYAYVGNVLTEDAATRMMRALGVPDAAICALYALHTPAGGCPGFWMAP